MTSTRRSKRQEVEVDAKQSAGTSTGTKRKIAATPLPKSTSKASKAKAAKTEKAQEDAPVEDEKSTRFIQRLAEMLKLQGAKQRLTADAVTKSLKRALEQLPEGKAKSRLEGGFSKYAAILCSELVNEDELIGDDASSEEGAEQIDELEDLTLEGLVVKAQTSLKQVQACGPPGFGTDSTSLAIIVKTAGAAVKALGSNLEPNKGEGDSEKFVRSEVCEAVDEVLRQLVAVVSLRRRLEASGSETSSSSSSSSSSSESAAAALVVQRHQRRTQEGARCTIGGTCATGGSALIDANAMLGSNTDALLALLLSLPSESWSSKDLPLFEAALSSSWQDAIQGRAISEDVYAMRIQCARQMAAVLRADGQRAAAALARVMGSGAAGAAPPALVYCLPPTCKASRADLYQVGVWLLTEASDAEVATVTQTWANEKGSIRHALSLRASTAATNAANALALSTAAVHKKAEAPEELEGLEDESLFFVDSKRDGAARAEGDAADVDEEEEEEDTEVVREGILQALDKPGWSDDEAEDGEDDEDDE